MNYIDQKKEELRQRVEELGYVPTLTIYQVKIDEDIGEFLRLAEDVGVEATKWPVNSVRKFKADLKNDPADAVLVMGYGHDEVDSQKDIEGWHPWGIEEAAVKRYCEDKGIELKGSDCVVLCKDTSRERRLVGMLREAGATVTICDDNTSDSTLSGKVMFANVVFCDDARVHPLSALDAVFMDFGGMVDPWLGDKDRIVKGIKEMGWLLLLDDVVTAAKKNEP